MTNVQNLETFVPFIPNFAIVRIKLLISKLGDEWAEWPNHYIIMLIYALSISTKIFMSLDFIF